MNGYRDLILGRLGCSGKTTGTHWINDAGYFVGPVCITNTHGVGAVHQGATRCRR
jgi:L-aminopeptidase/D-esterase-like protein